MKEKCSLPLHREVRGQGRLQRSTEYRRDSVADISAGVRCLTGLETRRTGWRTVSFLSLTFLCSCMSTAKQIKTTVFGVSIDLFCLFLLNFTAMEHSILSPKACVILEKTESLRLTVTAHTLRPLHMLMCLLSVSSPSALNIWKSAFHHSRISSVC